jgi:hypothetical protein
MRILRSALSLLLLAVIMVAPAGAADPSCPRN